MCRLYIYVRMQFALGM
uniref:Uncharacterized protein n=1 Tax=Rhizophora mucronata TaxID=61149 RepID=A0A2P2NE13_RHIMU